MHWPRKPFNSIYFWLTFRAESALSVSCGIYERAQKIYSGWQMDVEGIKLTVGRDHKQMEIAQK